MSFSFSSIGHAIASGLHDAVVGVEKVEQFIAHLDTPANEAIVSGLAGVVGGPSAVTITRGVFAVAGEIAALLSKGDTALTANLLNAGFDKAVLDDFEALIKSVPSLLTGAAAAIK